MASTVTVAGVGAPSLVFVRKEIDGQREVRLTSIFKNEN